ncbi:MAG: GAF domain-containing protein [Saprospiraceae bacterium]
MKLIPFRSQPSESPFRVLFSLEKQIEAFEKIAKDEKHPYFKSSKEVLEAVRKAPALRDGIEDMEELHQYEKEINLLVDPLFPENLQLNEIKSIAIPFKYTAFHLTKRFENILDNAEDGYQIDIAGFNEDKIYIYSCTTILMRFYQQFINVSRPLYINVPDKNTGVTKNYRVMLNVDFLDISKTEEAPELTPADIDELLLRGNDLEFWKSKFPPNSYIIKGFAMLNLFDATNDVILSKIRSVFLRNDRNVFTEFKEHLTEFMGIRDLEIGYSLYDTKTKQSLVGYFNRSAQSTFLKENENIYYQDFFCDNICTKVMHESDIIAISDVERYGELTDENVFYQRLHKNGIKSIILLPLKMSNGHVQLLELVSQQKNELNSLNAAKLEDIIPFIKIASERYYEENQNILESTIQENYTAIHPTVKWRFTKASEGFNIQKEEGVEDPVLEDIVFEEVYPLYAQSDIKGSSTARNTAIQADLAMQLSLVIETFQEIMIVQSFPIYHNLIYRVQNYLTHVEEGLKAGDEVNILEFLKREIYPVFNHLKTVNPIFEKSIEAYISKIDPHLHVVYEQRKSYEDSVNKLNDKLAAYLDKKQEEAQEMFPHYFERYKTDGVEFNMYIGASLVDEESFSLLYLHNLRLWQLETMCELEQVAFDLVEKLPYHLRVASLILIHSNPLAIRFSMEQKQFDVDGAYNARYEIVKKRIDKSHIKDTDERLTQPGKIAIVYSQDKDAIEYLNYIKYLQSKNLIGEVEMLELEDLQGVSGLKAIRVEVLYKIKKRKAKNGTKQLKQVEKGNGEVVKEG